MEKEEVGLENDAQKAGTAQIYRYICFELNDTSAYYYSSSSSSSS